MTFELIQVLLDGSERRTEFTARTYTSAWRVITKHWSQVEEVRGMVLHHLENPPVRQF